MSGTAPAPRCRTPVRELSLVVDGDAARLSGAEESVEDAAVLEVIDALAVAQRARPVVPRDHAEAVELRAEPLARRTLLPPAGDADTEGEELWLTRFRV